MVNTAEVGRETERRVARYFREQGWAGAERMVRTGFRTSTRAVADQGDLTGIPGLCVQVKSLRSKDKRHAGSDPNAAMELMVPTWLEETEEQRLAGGAVLGLLVVRRWTTPDPARWWCFLTLGDLLELHAGTLGGPRVSWRGEDAPVRLELQHVVAMLRAQGWGPSELDEVAG